MTDLPATRFRLELRLDTKPPRAVMSDITTEASTGSAEVELGAAPYQLGMTFTAATPSGPLQPQLGSLLSVAPAAPPPFDPALAGDDGVLSLAWELRDCDLDTQDETVLMLALTNRSNYFEVANLEVHLDLAPSDGSELGDRPDGSALISILPASLTARHIAPQGSQPFECVVVTRGPKAGLYRLSVEARYQLFYVQRTHVRDTRAIAHLPLRISSGGETQIASDTVTPVSRSGFEQITIAQRKLHMTDLIEKEAEYTQSRRRELHPIEHRVPLPGGGEICVHYRLVKGSHSKPDDSRCSYGYNPKTKETESYFSTSDEAALELKLVNHSSFDLRHVNITDVHLFLVGEGGGMGAQVDTDANKLPDGNQLFEVLPGEVYFGRLDPEDPHIRYLGLVTRGIKPGRFLVRFQVRYEIVDGKAWINLPLLVNPD